MFRFTAEVESTVAGPSAGQAVAEKTPTSAAPVSTPAAIVADGPTQVIVSCAL